MAEAVHVSGLRELQRAFAVYDRTLGTELRRGLREAAEPIRADAEQLARANISRIGVPWSQMRTGVTTTTVYVAPKQRGVKSRTDRRLRRPNLFDLLLGKSLEPALDRNIGHVEAAVELALDRVGIVWERG